MVSAEMLAKVSIGMDKQTVQGLLGTPLVRDPFDDNRWDYYYSLRKDGKQVKQTLLSLNFENGRLVKIDGQAAAK